MGQSAALAEFQRAQVIREVFFRGGARHAEHPARVQAAGDGRLDPAVHPRRGRQARALCPRPPECRSACSSPDRVAASQVRVSISPPPPRASNGSTFDGPWALFRMFDGVQIEETSSRSGSSRPSTSRAAARCSRSCLERAQPLPPARAEPVPMPDAAACRARSRDRRASATIPGWYGKLPSLGDFASRRLPAEFINAWDAWLQEVLQATRDALGEGWLDCYLTMPIWRFVLLPGLVGPSGWAGVLMPSVDRVGRQFPLTVAVALPVAAPRRRTRCSTAPTGSRAWRRRPSPRSTSTRGPDDLDGALADRRSADAVPETVDARRLGAGPCAACPRPKHSGRWPRRTRSAPGANTRGGKALWWTRGRVDGDPLMLTCAGLPDARRSSAGSSGAVACPTGTRETPSAPLASESRGSALARSRLCAQLA